MTKTSYELPHLALCNDMIKLESVCMSGWARLVLEGISSFHRLAHDQARTFERRLEQHHGMMVRLCGADWLDHYGKRSHDVPVEHL